MPFYLMTRTNYYVNSFKQNSWRYTCRPSPYLFYLLNLLSHGRQGWTKGSDPNASCPSRKGHFRSGSAYPQLSRVIQHNILLIFIIMIKGAALRYLNLALVLFPLLPKGQQLNLLIGISSFFLIQHHPLISVLDSSSLRRLLRRRQSTSTFSKQID